jgi:hypothetical protein
MLTLTTKRLLKNARCYVPVSRRHIRQTRTVNVMKTARLAEGLATGQDTGLCNISVYSESQC